MDKRRVLYGTSRALRAAGIVILLSGAAMWVASRGGPDPSNEWDVFGLLTPVALALGGLVFGLGWLLGRVTRSEQL